MFISSTKIRKLYYNWYLFTIFVLKKHLLIIAYDREITVCFTGHRTYDGSRNHELEGAIRGLYAEGYRIFLCGMAYGLDLEAGEVALALREELQGLKVVAVVAYEGMQSYFSKEQRAQFERVRAAADEVVVVCEHYSKAVYALRNNYLVDNASAVVAYFDGSKGGTAYTIRRARKHHDQIINIYNNPQGELF